MKFIKAYWGEKGNYMVSVRTNCYSSSLAHIQSMLAVLKRDHPEQDISDEEVTIVIYNTPSYKRIMGIEYYTKSPCGMYFRINAAPCKF